MKKLLALLTAALMIVLLAVPAAASGTGTDDPAPGTGGNTSTTFDYATGENETKGTTTTLKKHLVVDNDASIPKAEFTFSVTAGGTAAEATANTVKVFAGKNPELVKVNGTAASGKVNFAAGESTTAGAADDGIANSTDKKYASKDITLDFSGVNYDKPGVYRYLITEADPTDPIAAVGEKITTVDVYIQDVNGKLEVQGYVAYDGNVTAAPKNAATDSAVAPNNGAEAGTKDDKFVNELTTYELKVNKTVAGNQGDKEEEFTFTITIENAGDGTVVNVGTVDTGKVLPNGVTPGTTTYTADSTGKIEVSVEMGHNKQLVLTGIPKGATYKVEEAAEDSTVKGYTVTGDVTTAKTLSADAVETVTNTREGTIPTGIALGITGGVVLLALAVVYFVIRRRLSVRDEY